FQWFEACEKSLQDLKTRITSTPILAQREGSHGFVVHCDFSRVGLGCVLMQHDKFKANSSRQVKFYDKNHPLMIRCMKFGTTQ
ncbi:hypothetical protein MTR67_019099, partial [Solanum verrucosum]